jgi:hypothetical protein
MFFTASPLLGAIQAYVPFGTAMLMPVVIKECPPDGISFSCMLYKSQPAASSDPLVGHLTSLHNLLIHSFFSSSVLIPLNS